MNARIFPLVLAATLVSLSTGCSGMSNFLFGRGARCGLCHRLSTAGQALNPFAPAPGGGAMCAPGAPPMCGVSPAAPAYGPLGFGGPGVMDGGAGSYVGSGFAGADCNCGGVVRGYGGVADPYLGGVYSDGGMVGDNFMPREFDSEGNEIIGVGPPMTN